MNADDMVLTPHGLRFKGRSIPCVIGKAGLSATKREGDSATPVGTHRITGLWYRPDRLPRPAPWARPIGPCDLWCDASGHADYNHHVRAPFHESHENMRRADPLYDLVLTTDWNWPDATAGRGSAIFLHQWRRPHFGTEGCIAFAHTHLRWIAERATPGTKLIVPPVSSLFKDP
ncbi:MAG: L,D-transpeptidase family protein [Paracoccus sp. (in: a-proteobacteria)]|nr:L,D-transpeptidase family protein [Paracoccus sp. (in: a-proteobacteria)]